MAHALKTSTERVNIEKTCLGNRVITQSKSSIKNFLTNSPDISLGKIFDKKNL